MCPPNSIVKVIENIRITGCSTLPDARMCTKNKKKYNKHIYHNCLTPIFIFVFG